MDQNTPRENPETKPLKPARVALNVLALCFALSVLGSILAGPRTAPLSKALVFDTQAAASVSADQNSNEDVGEFCKAWVFHGGD